MKNWVFARLAHADKIKLNVSLDNLTKEGVIQETSPYASNRTGSKKDDNLRLCVDYREINKITVKDNFQRL